jgi:hypothetical protein
MMVNDNQALIQRLSIERSKLNQSLQLYRLAVTHRLDNEIGPSHKRVLCQQRAFQRVYEKIYRDNNV